MVKIEINAIKAYLKSINNNLLFEHVAEDTCQDNRHFHSALYFFLYADIEKKEAYKDFAFDLLQTALYFKYKSQSLSDLSFDTGLSGTGWILLKMSHYGFFEVDDEDIFRPIDDSISELIKCENTGNTIEYLCGLGFYLLDRISTINPNTDSFPIFQKKIDSVYAELITSLKATQSVSQQELYKVFVFKENYNRIFKISYSEDSLKKILSLKTQSLYLEEESFSQPQNFFYALKLLYYSTPAKRVAQLKKLKEGYSCQVLDNIYSKSSYYQVNHLAAWFLLIREFKYLKESIDSKSFEKVIFSLNTLLQKHDSFGPDEGLSIIGIKLLNILRRSLYKSYTRFI